jgi:hypothetical protein
MFGEKLCKNKAKWLFALQGETCLEFSQINT